jgi:hypothetical protein
MGPSVKGAKPSKQGKYDLVIFCHQYIPIVLFAPALGVLCMICAIQEIVWEHGTAQSKVEDLSCRDELGNRKFNLCFSFSFWVKISQGLVRRV